MESQDIKNAISGILVVDKPVGMTSHDVVDHIRRGTGIRRAGHTGTLDPRASGVLVVLVGPAVRLSEFVSASDKRYQAILRLGNATDTYDADGHFTRPASTAPVEVTEEQFNEVLQRYIGEIEQTPPAYSAVKVQGRKAYDLARAGEEVELTPRKIIVYHLEILEWAPRKWSLMCTAPLAPMSAPWQTMSVSPWAAELTWSACGGPSRAVSACGTQPPCGS